MRIEVPIHPTATTAHEAAVIEINVPGAACPFALDLDFTTLLRHSHNVTDLAVDFLVVAAVIYGCDKAVSRDNTECAEDKWTRQLSVRMPVRFPKVWNRVANQLAESISFLTGDLWDFRFTQAERDFIQLKPRRRRRKQFNASLTHKANGVCLFSGGLDSLIGATDWLVSNPKGKLFLVGHYDGDVKGPKHDQVKLGELLPRYFSGRFELVNARVGISPAGDDINLRSRSLIFIALASFFASQFGPTTPIFVPENGAIALNIPLTPSRRGSCSTRTVHPFFIKTLCDVMNRVGLRHPVTNPYQFKTKGEMVVECKNQNLLHEAYALSRSCAKGGHKRHWETRNARGCGRCVPCLFRRAALYCINHDVEDYGINVIRENISRDKLGADFLALTSFLFRNDTAAEIQRSLIAHGPLGFSELSDYVDVILRTRTEVRAWLAAKAPKPIRQMAGIP